MQRLVNAAIASLLLLHSLSADAEGVVIEMADKLVRSGISPHKDNVLLPLTYRSGQGNVDNSELIFQFSVKLAATLPNIYLAYTETSFWKFLDKDNSSPFRETNYNPEIFYQLDADKNPFGNWSARLGFEHQSNGQSLPLSRSWDRFYFWPSVDTEHGQYALKLWWRRPEERRTDPGDTQGDDNPYIYRYMGYAEFYFRRQHGVRHISGMLRGNPSTGKGALQVEYSWPLPNKNTFFFARIFSGYGESLIDYDQHINRLSVGLTFR